MRLSTRTVRRAVVCLGIAGPFGTHLGGSALALGPDAAPDGSPPAPTINQPGGMPTPGASPAATPAPARIAPQQRLMQVAQHPMVRLATELLGANPFSVAEPAPGNKEAG